MANTLGIDYAADVAEMQTDAGQTCTINGASVNCVAGPENRVIDIDAESDVVEFERSCIIREADVSSIPAIYSKVTITNKQYSVTDFDDDTDEGVIMLTLSRKEAR